VNWLTQKREVDKLATQAQADAYAMAMHRLALRKWSQQTFGNANALAWSFAAGTVWGVVRGAGASRSRIRSRAVTVANASLFAWRVANAQAP
jgi:hypothetical protein